MAKEEIEVKVLDINVEKTVKKIEALGGKKIFEGIMKATQYDFPEKSPHSLHEKEKMLRIRTEENTPDGTVIEMTLKEFHHDTKGMKHATEHAVRVDNFETMELILLALGVEIKKRRTKKRTSYYLKSLEVHFDFDTLQNLPCYLEIDAPSKNALCIALDLLEIKIEETRAMTQTEVEDYYREKNEG